MCFPSKKQNNNFADTNKEETPKSLRSGEKASNTKGAPAVPKPQPTANSTTPPPTLPPVTAEAPLEMPAPKVAIIIYSMYGHIAKRTFQCFIRNHVLILFLVAEAEKVGIEEAGGKAEIFQYVHILRPCFFRTLNPYRLGLLRLSLKKSSPKCTLPQSLTILSSPPISLLPLMPSFSASPLDTVTCPHNGR